MSTQTVDCETLDYLLNEMDVTADRAALDKQAVDYWVCHRKHPRHPFRAACVVRFMPSGSFQVAEMPGRTRNLSRNGVGFIARRLFAMGEPIELELLVPGRAPTYMAGLVRFCRYAGRGFHELGIELKIASPERVFSHNPIQAMHMHDWLRPHGT